MRIWCLLIVFVSLAGCKRESSDASLAVLDVGARDEIAARSNRAVSDPKVTAELERCFATITSEPRVATQAGKLAEQLMGDPAIAGSVGTLMQRLTDDPHVMDAVEALMKQHPGASQDEIGELFGKQFEVRWETPEVDAEWQAAFAGLLDLLGKSPEMSKLESRVMTKVFAGIDTPERIRKFNARIIELNGGSVPDGVRGGRIYLDHAWAEPRIRDIAATLFGSTALCKATATFAAGLLGSEGVTTELRTALAKVAASEPVQKLLLRTMQLLYAKDLNLPALRTSLRALLVDPTLVRTVSEVLDATARSPLVTELASQWFETVRRDPQLATELTAFVDGW